MNLARSIIFISSIWRCKASFDDFKASKRIRDEKMVSIQMEKALEDKGFSRKTIPNFEYFSRIKRAFLEEIVRIIIAFEFLETKFKKRSRFSSKKGGLTIIKSNLFDSKISLAEFKAEVKVVSKEGRFFWKKSTDEFEITKVKMKAHPKRFKNKTFINSENDTKNERLCSINC